MAAVRQILGCDQAGVWGLRISCSERAPLQVQAVARADTNLGASDFDSIKQLFMWLLAALVSRSSDELRCKLPGLLEPLPVAAGAVQQLKVTVRLGAAKAESSRVLHEPCMFHAECRLPTARQNASGDRIRWPGICFATCWNRSRRCFCKTRQGSL